MINITLPDGTVRQYDAGSSAMDVAMSISEENLPSGTHLHTY